MHYLTGPETATRQHPVTVSDLCGEYFILHYKLVTTQARIKMNSGARDAAQKRGTKLVAAKTVLQTVHSYNSAVN